ncbi:MAG: Na(+)-translocating NADH-quinone reductase subunit C [Thermoguttaceae bacterium]|nr:Na(+)-translocating NADH-quinone reductase subunit C [Thermoguttaceae bacterium]
MSNKESISKTFAVATGVCVVCAVVVSFASVSLKPLQEQNKLLDKQKNILKASGVLTVSGALAPAASAEEEAPAGPAATPTEIGAAFSEAATLVVELETGAIVADADPAAVEADKTNFVALAKTDDVASIKTAPKLAIVYAFRDENGAFSRVVLPIKGTGLWSTMHGFISLEADLRTIAQIVFYDHGETPGLGGEISNPAWTSKWVGKLAYDDAGATVRVVKGAARNELEVDGISGATLTGNGVGATLEFWLGAKGFGPFLAAGAEPIQRALDAIPIPEPEEAVPAEAAASETANDENGKAGEK